MRTSFLRPSLALLSLFAVATGCNPKDFEEYEKSAPIRAYKAPNTRKPGFGRVMTAFQLGPDASDRSIVVASSGRDSAIVFERMWTGSGISDEAIVRCKKQRDCRSADGLGLALIPVVKWARGTPQEQTGCILSPGIPKAYIFCDSETSINQSWELALGNGYPPAMSAVHFSGAGLPEAHPLGVALIGTHDVSVGGTLENGRIFYQPEFLPPGTRSDSDVVPSPEPLPLFDPSTQLPVAEDPSPGDLGYAISTAENDEGVLLIAVSQPSRGRVIVASFDDRRAGSVADKLRTHACVESPEPGLAGFGKRLLLGDINDDGQPELFAGIDAADRLENPQQRSGLWMYRGATLPSPDEALASCPSWPSPVAVECRDARGIACDDNAFGASVALGDVDADGYHDLIVGAPYATVKGKKNAGAVWLIPGGEDDAASGGLDFERAAALSADEKSNAQLGTSVAALRTEGRYEPVAGAPGDDHVYTFMCTPLEQDRRNNLCLP